MPDRKAGKPKRLRTDLFIVVFLAVQILVPLRGFVHDKLETRGNFSWNMYSKLYRCRIAYRLRFPDGGMGPIDHGAFFATEGMATKVMRRQVLPEFHAWMCDELVRQGREGSIEASVRCSLNGGPYRVLVEQGTPICTAPNHGVLSR